MKGHSLIGRLRALSEQCGQLQSGVCLDGALLVLAGYRSSHTLRSGPLLHVGRSQLLLLGPRYPGTARTTGDFRLRVGGIGHRRVPDRKSQQGTRFIAYIYSVIDLV